MMVCGHTDDDVQTMMDDNNVQLTPSSARYNKLPFH